MAEGFLSSPFVVLIRAAPSWPTQSRTDRPTDRTYAGELRLYYDGKVLTPKSSTYGLVRKRKKKDSKGKPTSELIDWHHNGVDIYAPSNPFPREVPVVAVCDGTVEFVWEQEAPNDMGNRAWLFPGKQKADKFVYGHLNRFEGRNRRVVAGEIIGYVGCSGNADFNGRCSAILKDNPFNMTTAHLHLSWFVGSEDKSPLEKLGWTLRFADDLSPIKFEDWDKKGHTLAPDAKSPALLQRLDFSRFGHAQRWPRPVRPEPGDWGRIDNVPVHDPKHLASTARCYRQAHDRWAVAKPDEDMLADRRRWRALARQGADRLSAIAIGLQRHKERLAHIQSVFAAADPSQPDLPDQTLVWEAHVLIAEAMFLGVEAIMLAACGPAMRASGANRRKTKEERLPLAVPDGAVGINGVSYVHAFDQGIATLHLSTLPVDLALNPPVFHSAWTIVAGHGPGSGRHAVLDAAVKNGLPAGLAQVFTTTKALVVAQQALCKFAARFVPSSNAIILAGHLNSEDGTKPGYTARVEQLRLAVGAAGTALGNLKDTDLDGWLAALARTGHLALAQAEVVLNPKGSLRREPNEFLVFRLLPPPAPPPLPAPPAEGDV